MEWLKYWNWDITRRAGNLPYTDPLKAGRHPFQTYLLLLCVVSGLPLLFGEPAADSIEAALPPWLVYYWAASLSGGALLALAGSFLVRNNYANALTAERAGLYFAGAAGVVYGAAIFIGRGQGALVAAAITLGFGLSCLRRASDIALIFKRALDSDPPDVDTEEGR